MKKGNITHMFFVLTFILCMSIKTVRAESAGIKTDAIDSARKLSVATQKVEREMNVEKLMSQYAQVESILLQNLRDSCSRDIKDQTYYSPLYAAIQAVRAWRIVRAEDALIEVIDYTLDQASLPVGLNVLGDFFYPAARSLVELRVDCRKVIKAIARADSKKRISLLSWVLTERLGNDLNKTEEYLKAEVERCDDGKENDNLMCAIGLIGKAKHSTDLIPLDFLHQPNAIYNKK